MGDMLNTALAVVAIATLAGLGLMRGTVTGLRENLKDCREEAAETRRKLEVAEAENSRLQSDLAALSRVVTGEAHITALGQEVSEVGTQVANVGDRIDTHHTAAEGFWSTVRNLLTEIRDDLRGPS